MFFVQFEFKSSIVFSFYVDGRMAYKKKKLSQALEWAENWKMTFL